jgi:hypothetical protein
MDTNIKVLMAFGLVGSQMLPIGCSALAEKKTATKSCIIWLITEKSGSTKRKTKIHRQEFCLIYQLDALVGSTGDVRKVKVN